MQREVRECKYRKGRIQKSEEEKIKKIRAKREATEQS